MRQGVETEGPGDQVQVTRQGQPPEHPVRHRLVDDLAEREPAHQPASSPVGATEASGASSGPRRSRTRSINAVALDAQRLGALPDGVDARRSTAGRSSPRRRRSPRPGSPGRAPASSAPAGTATGPAPVAVSRAMRCRRSPCSRPSSSCAATSMSSRTPPEARDRLHQACRRRQQGLAGRGVDDRGADPGAVEREGAEGLDGGGEAVVGTAAVPPTSAAATVLRATVLASPAARRRGRVRLDHHQIATRSAGSRYIASCSVTPKVS